MKKGIDYPGVSIVFACHDGEGNYLFSKRSPRARDEHGTWDPGAGGLEFGAGVLDTLKREIREEYSTDALEIEFLGYRDDLQRKDPAGTPMHWVALDFRVRVDPGQARNGEPQKFEEVRWFRLDELPSPMHTCWPEFVERYRGKLT